MFSQELPINVAAESSVESPNNGLTSLPADDVAYHWSDFISAANLEESKQVSHNITTLFLLAIHFRTDFVYTLVFVMIL